MSATIIPMYRLVERDADPFRIPPAPHVSDNPRNLAARRSDRSQRVGPIGSFPSLAANDLARLLRWVRG